MAGKLALPFGSKDCYIESLHIPSVPKLNPTAENLLPVIIQLGGEKNINAVPTQSPETTLPRLTI
jgi:hypothetical protein